MNKLSRLTALLLALMMLISTFAAAETGYPAGGMTVDQWQQMVDQAADEVYVINEGDSGKTVTPEIPAQPAPGPYAPYTDGTTTALVVSENPVTALRTPSGVAVLTHAGEGQWQMLVGDVWADLTGETGDFLWVTPAMMSGFTTAQFRKALAPKDERGQYTSFTQVAEVSVTDTLPAALYAAPRADASAGEETADGEVYSLQRANENLEKYLITIEYRFLSNSDVAANPYYAEVSTTTTSFSAEIPHPIITGYKPTASFVGTLPGGFDYTETQMTLSDVHVTENLTVVVYYEPAEVKYTVNYWEELAVYTTDPATGEEVKYAPAGTVEDTGLTESTVRESSPDTTTDQYWATLHTPAGFQALLYDDTVKLAADGSTVVDIYYQRKYYLMVFNLGGGYGVNPIYAKHGVEIGKMNEPRRPGYKFMGYTKDKDKTLYTDGYDGKLETIPATVPIGNVTYYAVWQPKNTEFIVAYWLEDPNQDGVYNFWGSYKVPGTVGDIEQGVDYKDYPWEVEQTLDVHERHYSYYSHADQDVTISGDGDTVVNVYYKRERFTLKFYYAQQSGDTHYVIGGSTFRFGATATISDTGDEIALLSHYMSDYTTERGQVAEQPTLNAKGLARGYTLGSDTTTVNGQEYQYHYLSFTAKYGADISNLWPCDVFNPVEELNEQGNGWDGNLAYQSAWNAEHHVYFAQHLHAENNGNQTIKGNYDRLDYKLLWDNALSGCGHNYGDSQTVAYLCFWENGAKNDWNVPELYRYKIWMPVLAGQDETGLEIRERGGIRYYMRDVYDTIDNSIPHAQVAPAITGFSCINANTQEWDEYEEAQANWQKDWVGWGKVDSNGNYAWMDIPKEYYEYNEDGSQKLDADGNPIKTVRYAYEINWFYERNTYDITYTNYGAVTVDQNIPFEQNISGLYYVPSYPEEQEEGMLTFEGWYTSQDFIDGTEFEFTTMPNHNLMLYAKWTPKKYTVTVYNTKEDADTALSGGTAEHLYYWPKMVEHGKAVSSVYTYTNPDHYNPETGEFNEPTREGWTFTYWFYYDENGDEQAFSFNNTPITRDTVVYAGWTASELATYTIYYVVDDGNPNTVNINQDNWVGAPVNGSGLAGATTTERAKGGTELYTAFQTEYFPTVESHSFTLDVDASKNVYVFEYVKVDKVPYKVLYVTAEKPDDSMNKGTVTIDGKTYYMLADTKVVDDNTKAVVTENYTQIGGSYVPDAFQKRLILKAGTSMEENVIVFYYTKDETSTTLEVNHILVHADGSETPYDSVKQIVKLPHEETVTPKTIANYPYKPERTTVQGEGVTTTDTEIRIDLEEGADGVVINLYYVENTVDIQYIPVGPEGCDENGVPNATAAGSVDPETETVGVVTGHPGSTATANQNYSFVGWYKDAACTNLVTRDADFAPEKVNGVHVEAIYYAKFVENEATINYVVVGPAGCGTVDPESETLPVLSGEAEGSTAAAKDGYTFLGWYEDEAGQQPVDAAWVTDGKITPRKPGEAWPQTSTYYAKFEENKVTIQYVAGDGGTVDVASETLGVWTGTAAGSTAQADEYHTFVGWYADPDYTEPALSADAKYVPAKVDGKNVEDIYYAKFVENEATINYVVVGPAGCGTVDPESEKLPVLSGEANGSTAAANVGYTFLGWYDNPACEGTALSTNPEYVPTKAADEAWPQTSTYYAKFEENKATIRYAVGPAYAGMGAVSPESETLLVWTDTATGSEATPTDKTIFEGWYLDAECTKPVPEAWMTGTKITPAREENAAWVDGAIYYAKFAYKPGQLDITKTVVNNTGRPLTVTAFTFTVTLTDAGGQPLTGTYTCVIGESSTTVTPDAEGKIVLTLDVGAMNGEIESETRTVSASILNLPHGTQYAVAETHVEGCLITFENANGQIEATETSTAAFTNTFPAPSTSTLTVIKAGMQPGESAVIRVDVDGKIYYLSLSSTHSQDTITGLPIGSTYTVAELNAWTWQYENTTPVTGEILRDGASKVTITNKPTDDKWMHDESSVINDLGDGSKTNINNQ